LIGFFTSPSQIQFHTSGDFTTYEPNGIGS
jgi:hypothetical protein